MNKKLQLLIIYLNIVFFLLFTIRSVPASAAAEFMSSPNYQLQGGNFDIIPQSSLPSGQQLNDQIGQIQAQIFTSKGVLKNSGFVNGSAASSLNLAFSPISVHYGTFTPYLPIFKNITLNISSGQHNGFTVMVRQNNPLTALTGIKIPDTVCDDLKNNLCTIDQSNLWRDKQSFGLGYRVQDQTDPLSPSPKNYYRPFSSQSRNETPVIILESTDKNTVHSAAIDLKLNISPQQPFGVYQNVINFIILPLI